jgi:hypothetical protein
LGIYVACREFKRTVAKTYPENWNMYIVVDATKKLELIIQNSIVEILLLNKENKALKSYNEFEL